MNSRKKLEEPELEEEPELVEELELVELPGLVLVDPLDWEEPAVLSCEVAFEEELSEELPDSEVVAEAFDVLEFTGEQDEVVPPHPPSTMAKASKRIDEWLLSFIIKPPKVTLSMA
jgi:hypothetical protein